MRTLWGVWDKPIFLGSGVWPDTMLEAAINNMTREVCNHE